MAAKINIIGIRSLAQALQRHVIQLMYCTAMYCIIETRSAGAEKYSNGMDCRWCTVVEYRNAFCWRRDLLHWIRASIYCMYHTILHPMNYCTVLYSKHWPASKIMAPTFRANGLLPPLSATSLTPPLAPPDVPARNFPRWRKDGSLMLLDRGQVRHCPRIGSKPCILHHPLVRITGQ